MYFDVKKHDELNDGDIFVTYDGKVRMIIMDTATYKYSVISLKGKVCSCWYDDIEELLSNYNVKEFYKNENLKIVNKEN